MNTTLAFVMVCAMLIGGLLIYAGILVELVRRIDTNAD